MIETDSLDGVIRALRTPVGRFPGVIGIDGIDGVGKSTLAHALHQELGGTLVSLDDFLEPDQGAYLPFLDYRALKRALTFNDPPKIVEGVCLWAALEETGRSPDVTIYVKRLSPSGHWHDERIYDSSENADTLIAKVSEQVATVGAALGCLGEDGGGAKGLSVGAQEIIRYHCEYRPVHRAQVHYLIRA